MKASPTRKRCLRGRRGPILPDCEELLLDTAKDVFLHRGAQGGTIREVARRAGLSATMIYYYFGSKEGLVCELFHRAGLLLLHELEAFCRSCEPGMMRGEVLDGLAALLRRHLGEDGVLGWLARDPGTRRYTTVVAAMKEVGGQVQECLATLPDWGYDLGRSSLDLKLLAQWALSWTPFLPGWPEHSVKAIVEVEDAWHERFWQAISRE